MKRIALSLLCTLFLNISFALPLEEGEIDYGKTGVDAYHQHRHGPDGQELLDPFIRPLFDELNQKRVLDAGCGAGPWAILAAQKGAWVDAIDIQANMINQARENAQKHHVENDIRFEIGDVRDLPYPDNSFDVALSINMICNLTSHDTSGLKAHLEELSRVLENDGKLLITGPSSIGELLTTGLVPYNEVLKQVHKEVSQFKEINDEEAIKAKLNEFDNVLRGTFTIDKGKLTLVTNVNILKKGQKIWRKIPGLVVPNFYHSEEEYIKEIKDAGFAITKISRPTLQRKLTGLGDEYLVHHPFIIFEAKKV